MGSTTFRTCTEADQDQLINFLESVKDDFPDFDRPAIEETTRLLFAEGGVIVGYKQQEMIGMLGYFLGEPARNFANKEIGFICLTALSPAVRLTRVFWEGLWFIMQTMQDIGIEQVRFHAAIDDRYTNRLYAHFATCIGKEENRRGYACNLYAASVSDVLAGLAARKQAQKKQPTPDSFHRSRRGFRRTQGY